MEEYFNLGIKELISRFPAVGSVLQEYDIGCVSCAVGTCLFKDIMSIHNLPAEQEAELMARLSQVIHPERVVPLSASGRKPKVRAKEIKYSPPIRKLVDEHLLIKRCIALLPELCRHLDTAAAEERETLYGIADFIRSYADKFHHAKEEEILFKYFDENLDVLNTMLADHTQARSHVRALLEAVEHEDAEGIIKHLGSYHDLLSVHIKKEDEILYPWMDRELSVQQIGELFSKFNEVDEKIGCDVTQKYENFVSQLETKQQNRRKEHEFRRMPRLEDARF